MFTCILTLYNVNRRIRKNICHYADTLSKGVNSSRNKIKKDAAGGKDVTLNSSSDISQIIFTYIY